MSTVVTGAIFTKVAGKSIGAIIGLVVGAITLVGLLFKTFTEVVHQDQKGGRLWFGRPARKGMMVYPICDFARKVFRRPPKDRPVHPEKVCGPGLHFYFPVIGRVVILETQDRRGECRTVGFYILVSEGGYPYRLNFEARVTHVWGLPENLPVYPRVAVLNAENFEGLAEDLLDDAVRTAFVDGYANFVAKTGVDELPEAKFQDSKAVFALAKNASKDELLETFGAEYRGLRIHKVTPVDQQTGEVAAAVRSTARYQEASAAVNGALSTFLNQPA